MQQQKEITFYNDSTPHATTEDRCQLSLETTFQSFQRLLRPIAFTT